MWTSWLGYPSLDTIALPMSDTAVQSIVFNILYIAEQPSFSHSRESKSRRDLSVPCQILSTTKTREINMAYNVATMDELIAELHKAFENDVVDVDHVTQLMKSYKSNPVEWKKFAKFDRYRYTRNLVDEGNGKFNLMLLCWGEGHSSAVHDHADAHCFMKMLDGTLKEVRFDWPSESPATEANVAGDAQELQPIGSTLLEVNGVCYINDSLGLHRVENPSHVDRSVSLHLYSPPFDTCHMFDQRTGKKTAAKVTFWSKFGERVPPTVIPQSCSIPVVIESKESCATTTTSN